ncbi:TetR/AcrR family transcriptional regulator [Paraburkholderia pallida]|uniref:TetR/AcrR family transcriptional regulator n=1 Tax=Paraburkholderia pallida TaxID=2547399 RepID=A0A4P7D023_9BURK|nr:TetR/AcrR family transcriptional regulator C-terminal domain-containing protein [Paraburkholderia pallida]QBR01178.1 TetR/AcrR family transcriptional regulator [Paraburkholderia pallida]
MKPVKIAPEETTTPTPRRAGRRPKSDAPGADLSRDAVIRRAIELAQKESISEVSMVRVAREMGVAPGLVHYYVGSKDDLLSAVLNAAFKERVNALPPVTGDWRVDLEGVCRSVLKTLARWPGVANYIATQNRFRLFQRVQPGETDYGLAYFDHLGRILEHAGFNPAQAALAYDLTMMFVTSISVEIANRQAPGEHKDFIVGYVSQFDREDIPGATFLAEPFTKIDSEKRLDAGLKLMLDGFETWLANPPADTPARRKTRRS